MSEQTLGRWDSKLNRGVVLDDEATAFLRGPGASEQGDCIHDFFSIGKGAFKCKWCGKKIYDEPGPLDLEEDR